MRRSDPDGRAAGDGGRAFGTVADIARELCLSEGTVRNHLSSAIGKTGAADTGRGRAARRRQRLALALAPTCRGIVLQVWGRERLCIILTECRGEGADCHSRSGRWGR